MRYRKTDLAWAAGLFEGEGCLTISHQRNGTQQARIKMNMIDEDVVRRFHAVIGVGTVVYVRPREKHHLPQWQWHTSAYRTVVKLVNLLKPWLGRRRRAQADRVVAEMRAYKTAGLRRQSLKGS